MLGRVRDQQQPASGAHPASLSPGGRGRTRTRRPDPVAPAGAGTRLAVELLADWDAFLGLEAEWNALVEATGDQPFYRHEYVRTWIESFAPGAALRLLAGRDGHGRLAAVLPLLGRHGTIVGLPVREWGSPTDVHSFRFDLVARDPLAAARALLPRLAAEPGWSVVRITDVPAGEQVLGRRTAAAA